MRSMSHSRALTMYCRGDRAGERHRRGRTDAAGHLQQQHLHGVIRSGDEAAGVLVEQHGVRVANRDIATGPSFSDIAAVASPRVR